MTDTVFLTLLAVTLGGSQPATAEFLDSYRSNALSWEEKFTRNIEIKATATTYDGSGRPDSTVILHLTANDRCRLARRYEVVDGVTQNEVWHLLRPDGYYVIHPSKSKKGYYLSRSRLGDIACHDVPFPLSVFTLPFHRTGRYLPDALIAQDARILADTQDGDGIRRLRVAERFGSSVGETEYRFRPNDYMMDGFRVVASSEPEKLHMQMKYKQYDFGIYPEQLVSHLISPGGKSQPSSRIEFNEVRQASFPDADFSLRRFDLPESVEYTASTRSMPLYLWILLAAAVCGLLAAGFRYLARSRGRKI